MNLRSVLLVGPVTGVPTGFNMITTEMLKRLQRMTQVHVSDMATGGGVFRGAKRLASALLFCMRPGQNPAIYLALSGGQRQWLDLPYILIATLLRLPLIIHHHSFAYIDRPTWLSRLCMKAAASGTHIVLCGCMGRSLRTIYKMTDVSVVVLSNAAYLPAGTLRLPQSRPTLVLGFLSNITFAKGIGEFVKIVSQLSTTMDIRATVAGPIDVSERSSIEALLRSVPNLRYIGPVYGEQKAEYFASIDILVFPTLYKNEAEPLTILEAMSNGVYVTAYGRGCIEEMVPSSCGFVADTEAVDPATQVVRAIELLAVGQRIVPTAIANEFVNRQTASICQLDQLIQRVLQ